MYYSASGFCTEYFIFGDPQKRGGAFVCERDTQSGAITSHKMVGVFDEYTRVKSIPAWARIEILKVLTGAERP